MISAYVGLPGSGKTYTVVENCIIPALRAGRTVVTNVALRVPELLAYCGAGAVETFDATELVEIQNGQRVYNEARWQELARPGVVLVIDEAWRLWPAGMQAKQFPASHATTFAEHRHMVGEDGASMEIAIVTQDLGQIAAYARQLIDTTYRTTKLDKLGMSRRYRVDVFQGGLPSSKLTARKRLRESYGTYRPEIFQLYVSHTKSATGSAGEEASVDSRRNVLLQGRFAIMLPIALVAVGASVWALQQFFGGEPSEAVPERAERASAPPREARPSVIQQLLPAAPPSAPARIGGVIRRPDGTGMAAVISDGRVYYLDLGQCWEEWPGDWACTWRGARVSF